MKNLLFFFCLCLSFDCSAVYKCTDAIGRTNYQATPCAEQHKAVEINPKTGGAVDLNAQAQQQANLSDQQKQQELQKQAEEQAKLEAFNEFKKQVQAEHELTQSLIKQNPQQFSAFAIPIYDPGKLPAHVQPFASRLVEIEKFRRLAAQKALASGQCQRVEADELNTTSKPDLLVFIINCSSGASFHFNETELKPL